MNGAGSDPSFGLKFYFDEHFRPAIVAGLRRQGVDCLTVQEDGWDGRSDVELLDRAAELGRVVVTNDSDFNELASERQRKGVYFAGIIKFSGGAGIGRAIDDLTLTAAVFSAEEMENSVQHLPLQSM